MMNAPVHILATVRKPELLPAALLVFQTLRVGFPSAPVTVWGNALPQHSVGAVHAAAHTHGCNFRDLSATSHDAWIEALVLEHEEPFWICDTDIVFHESVEGWVGVSGLWPDKSGRRPDATPTMAGRFEPAYRDDYTGSDHVERLHTCLMFINPAKVRCAVRAWTGRFPMPWRATAQQVLFRQTFVPGGRALVPESAHSADTTRPTFYDSLAGLYQAIGGTAFTAEQDAAFDHLHAATYVDELKHNEPALAEDLANGHAAIYHNPGLARGIKQAQDRFYEERKIVWAK